MTPNHSAEMHVRLTIRESETSPTCPMGRTRAEVGGLVVDRFQLGDLVLSQVDNVEVR